MDGPASRSSSNRSLRAGGTALTLLSVPLNLQEGSSWFRTQDISFTLEASRTEGADA